MRFRFPCGSTVMVWKCRRSAPAKSCCLRGLIARSNFFCGQDGDPDLEVPLLRSALMERIENRTRQPDSMGRCWYNCMLEQLGFGPECCNLRQLRGHCMCSATLGQGPEHTSRACRVITSSWGAYLRLLGVPPRVLLSARSRAAFGPGWCYGSLRHSMPARTWAWHVLAPAARRWCNGNCEAMPHRHLPRSHVSALPVVFRERSQARLEQEENLASRTRGVTVPASGGCSTRVGSGGLRRSPAQEAKRWYLWQLLPAL